MATCANFPRLFTRKNVFLDLKSTEKPDALKKMIEGLETNGILDTATAKDVLKAVLGREKVGSTGIGKGVAIPHAKVGKVKELVVALARSTEGLDFQAIDGEPVHILFMIVSPKEGAELHLDALKWVSKICRNQDFCTFFQRAQNVREVQSLLREMGEA